MTDLSQKAMLATLSISQWTARKYDKAVTRETNSRYEATDDAGRYNKALIAKAAISKVNSAGSALRKFHYDNTLPWGEDGARILPAKNYLDYTEKLREMKANFDRAVNEFCINYPDLVRQAKLNLGKMFSQEDYPDVMEIRGRFGVKTHFNPLPVAGDFRVDLQQGEVAKIKGDIEARMQATTNQAMTDLWNRLFDVVSKMSIRLNDTEKTFRDSLVGNVQELVQLLPKLNLTDDPRLEEMRQEIEARLCATKPKELRESKKLRKEAAKSADDILAAMAGYVGQEAA